jgi:hypothetical protein
MGPIEQQVDKAMNMPLGEQAAFLDATASLREDPDMIPWSEVVMTTISGVRGTREAILILARAIDGLNGQAGPDDPAGGGIN